MHMIDVRTNSSLSSPHRQTRLARIALACLLPIFLAVPVSAGDLKPFSSDGCSRFPDGTLSASQLWLSCCVDHDLAYWRGGTQAERQAADQKLKRCVAATGQEDIAELMLIGVRVGGSPYWPTSYRWGYGWPWLRGYAALTTAEQLEVDVRTAEFRAGRPSWPTRAEAVDSREVGNWYRVSERLYRSAQPSPAGFGEIEARGIKSVLNLRARHDDAVAADGRQLTLLTVPMYAFHLNEEKVVRALSFIQTAPGPILVHCQHGSDRTGTIVALYRILYQGWSRQAAIAEMTEGGFGFHPIFSNLVEYLQTVDINRLRSQIAAASSSQ
jgi:protein tyrosine phosphatase (PTP) superfamily phosphohydrolase (DUF442 family)